MSAFRLTEVSNDGFFYARRRVSIQPVELLAKGKEKDKSDAVDKTGERKESR